MTDAWATIIAALITSVITALTTLFGILISKKDSKKDQPKPRLKTPHVFIYVFIGLVIGGVVGVIIGFVLLTRPQPSASITKPTDGQSVPIYAEVTVEYNNIPSDRHLWLVVRIPGIGPGWLIYPQLRGADSFGTGKGVSSVTAAFGGNNDSGHPFNIVILLVDENANRQFVDYVNKCKLDSNLCTGMILPDKGVEILDFDTVSRE